MKGSAPPVPGSSGAPTPTPTPAPILRPPLQFGEWDELPPPPNQQAMQQGTSMGEPQQYPANPSSAVAKVQAQAGGIGTGKRARSVTVPHTPTSRPLARRSVSIERELALIAGGGGNQCPSSPGSSTGGPANSVLHHGMRNSRHHQQTGYSSSYSHKKAYESRKKSFIGFDSSKSCFDFSRAFSHFVFLRLLVALTSSARRVIYYLLGGICKKPVYNARPNIYLSQQAASLAGDAHRLRSLAAPNVSLHTQR